VKQRGERRILYVQYTNPGAYPPLQHSSQLLAEAGWDVLFLGTGAFGADCLKVPENDRVRVEKFAWCGSGWRQKVHFLLFCMWCLWRAICFRPGWIYASDLFSCPAAVLIRFVARGRIIYHEHDLPSAVSSGLLRSVLYTLRKRCAQSASLCVVPSYGRASLFRAEVGVTKVCVVWNCPRTADATPAVSENAGDTVRLLYHGSIAPGRPPRELIDALAALPDKVRLVLVGYETVGSRGYIQDILARAEILGVLHRIEYLGPKQRAEMMAICAACDIGIALIPTSSPDLNLKTLLGASNKVFDYLAGGLPVLVPALPDWEELFVKGGYGRSCVPDDVQDLTKTIASLIADPQGMRRMGERGRLQVLTEWNYERQFVPVWRMLHGLQQEANP